MEAAKKFFKAARPLSGGGIRAWPLRKKEFSEALTKFLQKMWLLSSKGGGRGKALVTGPLKNFFSLFKINNILLGNSKFAAFFSHAVE